MTVCVVCYVVTCANVCAGVIMLTDGSYQRVVLSQLEKGISLNSAPLSGVVVRHCGVSKF
jgi:hypothetical protein